MPVPWGRHILFTCTSKSVTPFISSYLTLTRFQPRSPSRANSEGGGITHVEICGQCFWAARGRGIQLVQRSLGQRYERAQSPGRTGVGLQVPGTHAVGGSSAFFPAPEGNLGSFRQTCWRAQPVRGWGRDLGSFRQTCNRARVVWGESPNWVRFVSESAGKKQRTCRNLASFLGLAPRIGKSPSLCGIAPFRACAN
jgi:hypothetical protein